MTFQILIIDDEQGIRDVFSLLLGEKGYRVETAASRREGADKVREFAPDLVLLDMNLPDGSGLDILTGLKPPPDGPSSVDLFILYKCGPDNRSLMSEKGAVLGSFGHLNVLIAS